MEGVRAILVATPEGQEKERAKAKTKGLKQQLDAQRQYVVIGSLALLFLF